MVNRVIFLDYDGVLNDVAYLIKHGVYGGADTLDPAKLVILQRICIATGASVVLTSSWRDDMDARRKLKKFGIKIAGSIPHKHDNRGEEIQQWLVDKRYTGQWIIIDDDCSDLSESQRDRLIYTREISTKHPILGLQNKHIKWAESMFTQDFPKYADTVSLTAILSYIENDWLRVMWNIHQEEYDNMSPFQNTGNIQGYSDGTFEVHAYDWNWDFYENDKPQPFNFKWRDFQVTWYKHMGRDMRTNRAITHDELALMLHECLESLHKYEQEHDDFENNQGKEQK